MATNATRKGALALAFRQRAAELDGLAAFWRSEGDTVHAEALEVTATDYRIAADGLEASADA